MLLSLCHEVFLGIFREGILCAELRFNPDHRHDGILYNIEANTGTKIMYTMDDNIHET